MKREMWRCFTDEEQHPSVGGACNQMERCIRIAIYDECVSPVVSDGH